MHKLKKLNFNTKLIFVYKINAVNEYKVHLETNDVLDYNNLISTRIH